MRTAKDRLIILGLTLFLALIFPGIAGIVWYGNAQKTRLYLEGQEAATQGMNAEDCPYLPGLEHAAGIWLSGYIDKKKESR